MRTIAERQEAARNAIKQADADLRALSLDIHAHPELNFEEHHAHATLTAYLEAAGFSVTRGAYGMPTAFEAVAGTGTPRIAFLSEFDALPGIGHACGHNLIAISGVAAALALRAALDPGEATVVLLGSPAEEGGGGKVYMIERGAFASVDAALMLHPSPYSGAWAHVLAIQHLNVSFHGRNAHAAAAPWEGVNALDAIVVAYTNIGVLRQQMRPSDRVHGVITEGGLKPNIIPDRTAGQWYVRARNFRELEELKPRVLACFQAAATATGCTLDYEWEGVPYADLVTNDVMAGRYAEHMASLGVAIAPKEIALRGPMAGSTDMGNVSYVVPSIHPFFAIPAKEGGNHTPGFTAAAATEEAHRATLEAATGLALTALDLALEPSLLAAAREEFEKRVHRGA